MEFKDLFFITKFFTEPYTATAQVLVVVFSVCCHEYFHARVALWQGDSTAADNGHLTLNPLRQMGPFSVVLLAFIGIAWGAVPVNPARMKHRYSEALVSFAGPAMNIILFLAFAAATGIASHYIDGRTPGPLANLFTFLYLGALINFYLFCLNMLPVPMLDGWKVYSYFFPGMNRILAESEFAKGIMFLAVILFLSFMHVFGLIGALIINAVMILTGTLLNIVGL
jgi:Zn-dependent protease